MGVPEPILGQKSPKTQGQSPAKKGQNGHFGRFWGDFWPQNGEKCSKWQKYRARALLILGILQKVEKDFGVISEKIFKIFQKWFDPRLSEGQNGSFFPNFDPKITDLLNFDHFFDISVTCFSESPYDRPAKMGGNMAIIRDFKWSKFLENSGFLGFFWSEILGL